MNENKPVSARLASLDALRGFDMFWITGGGTLIACLYEWTHWRVFQCLADQFEHAPWNGFHAYDLIFPLFLFISGVTMPFSLVRNLERGEKKSVIYRGILRRSLLLILLGFIYNGILQFDWANMRYASVLGRIGLAYGFSAIIVVNVKPRTVILWGVGILLVYWAALTLIPVPGVGAGVLTLEGSLVGFVDRHVLPGRLYLGIHDPEGLLSTVPAIVTALMGALTGYFLRFSQRSGFEKGTRLLLAGLVSLAVGFLWGMVFPVNKNLWTSSFVLVAGGWSLVLLAIFYLVIDVWGWKKWTFPFVLIGVNPITIYLASAGIIDFEGTTKFFVGGALNLITNPAAMAVGLVICVIVVKLLFLYILHRQKIYLKV